jgi:hypothetical protein
MYQCHLCKQIAPAGTRAHRIVLETRPRTYPFRRAVQRYARDGKRLYHDDPGGTGYETVREVLVCAECAARTHPTQSENT